MITDELLIGYTLKLLEPVEQSEVATALRGDLQLQKRLLTLQLALAPFAIDREPIEPPAGLAVATIARTAAFIVERGSQPALPPITVPSTSAVSWRHDPHWQEETASTSTWRPMELLVAGCVALLTFALMASGVQKIRHDRQVAACQNQMRQVHNALTSYSSVEQGRLPQAGTTNMPTAGEFAQELQRTGHLSSERVAHCPESAPLLPFAYTLGYRTSTGTLRGITTMASDWTPILADLPSTMLTDVAHSSGQNVLFLNGSVRFATIPKFGIDGDDIYLNDAREERAGLHPLDASLGSAKAVP